MFKFLHTADIHLDSPLLNLNKYVDAPREEFRSATRRAFDNIVELAITEDVKFVLIAGDLYDGDCSDFHTPLYFRSKMEELQAKGIRVFIINGNHDAASNMQKAFKLELPDNVVLFPTKKPATEKIEELKVAVHGQGFAQREVTDDLSKNYPKPVPGFINIGMLHTNCGGRSGHDSYAPSTVDGLGSLGYDYWALGHIHKKWAEHGPKPWIVYPGNPQGRHAKEPGPRGCFIATCDGDRIDKRFHETDVMRWYVEQIAIDECADIDSVMSEIHKSITPRLVEAGDRSLAVRLELTGKTVLHSELNRSATQWDRRIRESVLDRFDVRVWIEKIKFKTRAREQIVVSDSAIGELAQELASPKVAEFARCELSNEFEKVLSTIPHDSRLPADEIDLDNQQTVDQLIDEARDLLIGRLMNSGANA